LGLAFVLASSRLLHEVWPIDDPVGKDDRHAAASAPVPAARSGHRVLA
jgi:hypothetical protein